VKIGVIGAGAWGKNLIRNFHSLGVLTGVADPSETARAALGKEYPDLSFFDSSEKLIASGVDGVAIATPVPTHGKVAEAALNAGKHVFVEKPMTMGVDEAERLVRAADERKRVLMVGHLLMYQPAIEWIKKYVDAGKIGRLASIHQVRCNLGRARNAENVLWSFGVHDVAVLLYLVGSQPTRVQVIGQRVLQPKIEDDTYLHLEFENGAHAHLHNSWLWPQRERTLTVIGTEGMLTYDEVGQRVSLHRKSIDRELKNKDEGSEIVFEAHGEPLKLELEHFLSCIREGKKPISDGRSGVEVIRVLERASKSLEQK
jgi:predicted dehydrogenase